MAAKKTLLVGIVTCFILLTAGLVAAEMPAGVTETEIHIGQWGPQTGPAAPWGAVARGTGVFFDLVNEEGGINGRRIVYHSFDDQYNPANTKAGVKELQEKKPGIFAWACGVGTAPGLAVKDYLMDNKIPWVGPAAGSLLWVTPPQKYLFAVYPLYYDEAQILVRYLVTEMKMTKIAVLYANDEYGKNGLRGAKLGLEKQGLAPVIEVGVGRADRDLKSHVMKLKQSGAEAVLMWVNPTHAVITLKTATAMKYQPQWVSSSTLSDAPLMMHITGGLWKNVIFAGMVEPPDSPDPSALMQTYKAAFDKYAQKGERWGVFFLAGFGFVEPMVEGLKRTPADDFTRENFVTAMESIKDFQGIMGQVSYGPKKRQGCNQIYVAKTDETGMKTIQLTGWMTVD